MGVVDCPEMARRQGVDRPFRILIRMDEGSRAEIARALKIRLPVGSPPEVQAWDIINRDGRGLQARTHRLTERLSPFSRNNNWWEIVTRTAEWLRVPYYPGLSERQIERLLFESIADRLAAALRPEELSEIDRRAEEEPPLYDSLEAAGLSPNGIRLVFSGLWRSAPEPKPLFPSWSRGLSQLLERSRQIFAQWSSLDAARRIFRPNEWRLAAALSALYLRSLVEENLEEFQSLRS